MESKTRSLLWGIVCSISLLAGLSARVSAVSVPCSATDLVNAVQAAVNTTGVPTVEGVAAQTLDLAAGCTYTLTTVNTGAGSFEGPSGLPVIKGLPNAVSLTINGNGATITRLAGAPQFRFFTVISNNTLNLNNLSLTNGRAADDAGTGGNGGLGGAISNFGTLSLVSQRSRTIAPVMHCRVGRDFSEATAVQSTRRA